MNDAAKSATNPEVVVSLALDYNTGCGSLTTGQIRKLRVDARINHMSFAVFVRPKEYDSPRK
jgi:hypothetical protein